METNRKMEQAFTLYKQRLQNLTQVINDLHNVIKNDEVVTSLKDPSLQKYRINRVNELVSEILNNQKQKIIIRVLQKYEQVGQKLKQKQKQCINNKNNGKEKQNNIILKQKHQKQISNLRMLIREKDILIEQNGKQLQRLKQNIVSLNNQKQKFDKQCIKCIKYNQLQYKMKQLQQQNQISNKIIEKLKKDGEEAVQNLNEKIKQLSTKNKKLQNDVYEKQIQLKALKNDQKQKNTSQKRNQKIQVMKRQIVFLQEELIEVQRQFNIVKDLGLETVLSEIKKLKSYHKKLKQFCIEKLQSYNQQNSQLIQKLVQKIIKVKYNSQQTEPILNQKLMSKLNILDNELDYFIENQLLIQ